MTHAATSTTKSTGRDSRSFGASLLLGVAAFTIALAGMRAVADIVGPVVMALVITITLHPIRTRLERRLPGWATSGVMLVLAVLLLSAFAFALIVSVAQLASLVPGYTAQIQDGVAETVTVLKDAGVQQEQIDAVATALDPGQLIDLAMSVLSSTLGLLTDLFFLVTVLLFMAFDTDSTRSSLTSLGRRFPDPVAALDSFAHGTRSYMAVSASFGLVVAAIDGVALYLLGVPGAFVWAVLAFVTNFIPNIGFVIGVIPPALIALLEGGPGLMLTVIVLYSVINFVIQSIIQPRVVGDSVGLSPTLTFLSLVFWTWVIGPVGALLAVPLSLLTRSLLVESDPQRRWALPVIAGKPEVQPPPDPPEPAATPAPRPESTPG